jgi:hypothetical protein
MKRLLQLTVVTFYSAFSYGQCTQNAGIDYDLGSSSNHTANYLLGSAIVVTSSCTLNELGFISVGAGQNFKVAVYDDAAGNPGNLLTEGAGTVVAGTNIVDVPDVALVSGTYYFMAVFATTANLSYTTSTSSTVWYISHTFSNPLPASFGAPLTYTGQDFSYYFINTIPGATGTDMQTACDSYTWIDGLTYTSSNNTATFNIVGGASNGCDSLVTLDLTINSVSDISTSLSGLTVTANNSGATYQWLDCDNAYSVIAGETGSSLVVSANGDYAVQLTENGCVDTSACTTIDFVGLADESFGNEFSIYPNPTNGNFSVDLGTNYASVKTTITDLTGRIIHASDFSHSTIINFDISEPAGIYLLTIESEENKVVFRLVKQ